MAGGGLGFAGVATERAGSIVRLPALALFCWRLLRDIERD
jgi:hypothetical protein